MRSRPVAITELPRSPREEQGARMRRYAITMAVRTLCVVAAALTPFVLPGWWFLIPALGAVFLPYVAVVLANAVAKGRGGSVERPGALAPRDPS